MEALDKYKHIVEMSQKRKNVGRFECKFRPITPYAETIFGKHISLLHKKYDPSILTSIVSERELNEMKQTLTEANFKAAGFDDWYEIAEFEYEESEYITFKTRVLNNFCNKFRLHTSQVNLILGDFEPYDNESELDFGDIIDLRKKA